MSDSSRVLLYFKFTVFLVLQFFMVTVSADETLDHFGQGVAASKQGNFAEAVLQFEQARASGKDSPALDYNLGVAYYRTGDFANAKIAFGALTGNSKHASLAHYNLGLIALKQGDKLAAQNHFEVCFGSTSDKKLKSLSLKAFKRAGGSVKSIKGSVKKKKASPWHGRVSLSVTYDSNVGQDNEDEINVTEQDGVYYTAQANTGAIVSGTKSNGIRLDASAYSKNYQSEYKDATLTSAYYASHNYKLSQYRVAIGKTSKVSAWETRYRLAFSKTNYGGNDYQGVTSFYLQGKRYIDKRKYVRATWNYADIDAADSGPDYSYLSGDRHRVKMDVTIPEGNQTYRLSYMAELNNRDDNLDDTIVDKDTVGFRSYSANRNTLRVDYFYRFAKQWRFNMDAQYRHSEYRDEDVITAGAGGLRYNRVDHRRRFSVGVNYKLAKQWRVSAMLRNTDNNSNRVQYSQSLAGISIHWSY